jgi:hypothetical protein
MHFLAALIQSTQELLKNIFAGVEKLEDVSHIIQ